MLAKVLALNVALVTGLLVIGYLPALLLEKKSRPFSVLERVFIALVFGYFLFQTAVAIVVTGGETVQCINLLPILVLMALPNAEVAPPSSNKDWLPLVIPLFILVFSSWYFVHSYAPGGQEIQRYPFIDIVSYATTATGMMVSGHETVYADAAIYYPHLFPFSLYHFTELWTLVGLSKITGVTPLYGISFLVPVAFLVMISLGLISHFHKVGKSVWIMACLIFSFLFANGKLLLGNDIFLFNILDLCGLKISLLIPLLLFLAVFQNQTTLLLAFSLWLPQANILYVPVVGLIWVWILIKEKGTFFRNRPILFWTTPILFCFWYGFLLFSNPVESQSFSFMTFSLVEFQFRLFSYFREAVMNMGYQYWVPFLVLSSVFISSRNALLLIPFVVAKGVSKLLLPFVPVLSYYGAMIDMLVFMVSFWFLKPFLPQKINQGAWLVFAGLFILCFVGAVGHVLTGFMDFEQFYTLMAAALFFLVAFYLFQVPASNHFGSNGFIPGLLLCGLCLGLTFQTFRLQRVLPFNTSYYKQIEKVLEASPGSNRSVYFSLKPYYPFPLHVQAGFPLGFSFSDALSTPVTMLEPNNWKGTSRESQVMNFPFMLFAKSDSIYQKDGQIPALQIRFISHFGIRYLWVDKGYSSPVLDALIPFRKTYLPSPNQDPDFWELDIKN